MNTAAAEALQPIAVVVGAIALGVPRAPSARTPIDQRKHVPLELEP